MILSAAGRRDINTSLYIDIPLLDNTKYSHWDMYLNYDSVGCDRIRYRVIHYSDNCILI